MNEKIYEYDAIIRSSEIGKGGAYVANYEAELVEL